MQVIRSAYPFRMSNDGHICGVIEESSYQSDDPGFVARWNDAAIARIPETDDSFPGLVRSMFAAPTAGARFTSFRGTRGIGVTLYANDAQDFLHIWLPKLESVLKQLLWTRCRLYIDGGYMGRYQITYTLDETALAMRTSCLRAGGRLSPPQSFSFVLSSLPTGEPHPLALDEVRALPTHNARRPSSMVPDRVRVERILSAATFVQRLIRDHSRATIENDEMLRRALIHTVREAAAETARLSNDAIRKLPEGAFEALRGLPTHDNTEFWIESAPAAGAATSDRLWNTLQYLDGFIASLQGTLASWPPVQRRSFDKPIG